METETNFVFSKYEFNDTILKLYYNTDNYEFIEEIDFRKKPTEEMMPALNLSFQYLHIVAGISYYKTFLPKNIIIKTCKLNKEQSDFFNTLYFNGLGEFSYKNKIFLDIKFPFEEISNSAIDIKLLDRTLLPIGGGKDSLVAFNILKNKKTPLYTFSVNSAKPIKDCCDFIENKYNVKNIIVTRKISPTLLNLVKNNIGYNGHVPISSIIAFISVCSSIIYNCNAVSIANEKSANIGNVEWQGRFINHQWSKSETAEVMFREFIKKYITSSFTYYSIVRPYYEIAITKKFAELKEFHNMFSSCNKNFKITAQSPQLWCCDCDKCRFIFLALASFMKKQEIINIFGRNMFDDETQLSGYEKLVGLLDFKPFECVGEIEESILAFLMLKESEFKDDFIVKNINSRLENFDISNLKNKYLSKQL